ncbi:MAG: sulfate/molybdate ABC transporter ATP-binding protein [Ancalomicrobiaceae bacterium]|nr:sulfate/molybdate ABC transporter ATP-binding protein [Ancalomicrobiaceae bacterium]
MDIRVRHLAKEFKTFRALHGVDVDIASGELLALLGPSGSGKTTLLRVIAGLEEPTGGQVFFGDVDATSIPVRERGVGFVFQNYALFKHMTVARNIAFGLEARPRDRRPSSTAIAARVEELLDFVQLSGLGGRYPAQLSGGQRQRVALARALAVEPKVLLLDEPFGALDAKVRKELRKWLRIIHDKTGLTTIFVTHDQDEALELADRIVVLNKGLVEQIGSADDIYDRPASPFVYDFIGDAVGLDVAVQDGRAYVGNQSVPLGILLHGYGTGRLYVRPHHWQFSDAEGARLVGTVVSQRRSGSERRAEVELAPGVSFEISVMPGQEFTTGDRLGMRPQRWRLFTGDGRVFDPTVTGEPLDYEI